MMLASESVFVVHYHLWKRCSRGLSAAEGTWKCKWGSL